MAIRNQPHWRDCLCIRQVSVVDEVGSSFDETES